MGGFFMARRGLNRTAEQILAQAEQSFARQGFAAGRLIATPFADILVFPKIAARIGVALHEDNGKVLIATGTAIYRDATGSAACGLLARDLAASKIDWGALVGHYCIITADSAGVRLFTDALGTYHVFHDQSANFISSSFLAVLEALPRVTLARQSAYEYVFQEATYGGATLVDEISLFDCRTEFAIGREVTRRPVRSRPVIAPCPPRHDADLLVRNLNNLRRSFTAINRSFGERVDTALSGGYDSRLIAALLLEQGVRLNVHVYGAPGDRDVAVAKEIAAGEGFELAHTDKGGAPQIKQDAFAAHVRRNLHAFDGAPADGVFDNGTDLATRRERCARGELMLNGGGGEVFRNFFYLPQRDYSVREFVWAFYSQFDPAAMRPPNTAAAFTAVLAEKVMDTLGRTTGAKLSRDEVEFLYPAFRCRFWMGRNNSNNNRLGYALTPFIDPNVVPDALAIPLREKAAGRFEAEMIRTINSRLAAYPSAYGHDFAHPPPFARVAKEWLTMIRPPWLRRLTFRTRHRKPEARPYFLTDPYLRELMDLEFSYTSRLFNIARVHQNGQFNRLCTLELLCQTFSIGEQR